MDRLYSDAVPTRKRSAAFVRLAAQEQNNSRAIHEKSCFRILLDPPERRSIPAEIPAEV